MNKKLEEILKLEPQLSEVVDYWGLKGIEKDKKVVQIKEWLINFEHSEIPIIYKLLYDINLKRDTDINECIRKISNSIKSIFKDSLNYISFFSLGNTSASSGTQFLYKIRKSLKLDDTNFPIEIKNKSNSPAFVFIDDFIGSGKQATEFYNNHLKDINIDCFYFSLFGFEKGIEHIKINSGFKEVITANVLSDKEKIFSNEITSSNEEKAIKSIALKYGKKLYPKHPLGYENSQSLICFLSDCPNNTLPIIWAGPNNEKLPNISWNPLFERKWSPKKSNNLILTNDYLKHPESPEELITSFYDLLRDKEYGNAFNLLSSNLKLEKYNNDVKYFNYGFENTISIHGIYKLELNNNENFSRWLVYYDESLTILQHNEISKLTKYRFKDFEKISAQLNSFKKILMDELNAEPEKVENIPLMNFFSTNAIEECCWLSGISYSKAKTKFNTEKISMSRVKYVYLIKRKGKWFIDDIRIVMHSSELYL